MIDLFKLQDNTEDRGAYSWIVVDGPKVFFNFRLLVNKITEKSNCSIKSLSGKISERIGCSTSMLYDILNGKTKWLSLRLIDEFLTILREFNENQKATKIKNEFLNSIGFLKSAPRSPVKIKAVKKLSPELAELCGIHAADGSLNLQISIEALRRERINKVKRELNNRFPKLKISRPFKRENKYRIFFNVTNETQTKIFEFLNGHDINFSLGYRLEFVDSDKRSMEYLKKLIFTLFGYHIKIETKKKEKGGYYYVHFSNKILGRYLKNIFDFPVGKKSSTVNVPKLIKNASFSIQRAFVRGLIQFDGSVRMNGNVALSTNSKQLLNFVLSTFKKDKLEGNIWESKNRKGELGFESPPAKKWLTYFIKGTQKYRRLYEHIYGFRGKAKSPKQAMKIFEKTFPSNSRSFLTFPQLIKTAKKLGEFTRYQILNKVKSDCISERSRSLPAKYKSLSVKLDILEKANIIKVNPVEMPERFKRKSDKIVFNNKFREWKLPLLRDEDIDEVVEVVHNVGLSKKVAKLVPLAVIKGE